MKTSVRLSFAFGLIFLLVTCAPKEDLTPTKQEIVKLRTKWLDTQSDLTNVMTDMKNASKDVNDQLHAMKSIFEKGNARIKSETDNFTLLAMEQKDVIKTKMDSLNLVIHDWGEHSKILNNLIKQVQEEDITVAEASKIISELRDFEAQTDPIFHHTLDFLAGQKKANQPIANFVRKNDNLWGSK